MILKRAHSGKIRASTYNVAKYASAEGNTDKLVFAECHNTQSSYAFGDDVNEFCNKIADELESYNAKFDKKFNTKNTAIHDHFIVALPLSDGKTHEEMKEYMLEALEESGWDRNRPFMVFGHDPKSGNHMDMHLIAARRDFSGKGFNPNKINDVLGVACSKIEKKFGLQKIERDGFGVPLNRNSSRQDYVLEAGTRKVDYRKELRSILEESLSNRDFSGFLSDLRSKGVTPLVTLKRGSEEEIQGLKFAYKGVEFKSSSFTIGANKTTYKELKKRYGFEDEHYLGVLKKIQEEFEADQGSNNYISRYIFDFRSKIQERSVRPFSRDNTYLERILYRTETGEYRFSKTGNLAFREEKDSVKVLNTSDTSVKAAVLLAHNKIHSEELHLSGTDDFKRKAWIQYEILRAEHAKTYNKKISGFKPSDADLAQLEKLKSQLIKSSNTISEGQAPAVKPDSQELKDQVLSEIENKVESAYYRYRNGRKP